MKKISTLFKKDPNDLGRVINEINPENEWVISDFYKVVATRKIDGSASAIIGSELYKRYDVKKGKQIPIGAIPCQEADAITGHHPHWVKCDRNNPSHKFHFEAFDKMNKKEDGTYELCGEKVNGNPEKIIGHSLIRHGHQDYLLLSNSFDEIKKFLYSEDIEGIVFHHVDGRMCKIRKSDFGFKRFS